MDKPAMDEPKASQLGQLLAYGTPNCRLVVVEARRGEGLDDPRSSRTPALSSTVALAVLLAPSTRLTASYDERCMYSYDLVVTEAADDDAETALMRFTVRSSRSPPPSRRGWPHLLALFISAVDHYAASDARAPHRARAYSTGHSDSGALL